MCCSLIMPWSMLWIFLFACDTRIVNIMWIFQYYCQVANRIVLRNSCAAYLFCGLRIDHVSWALSIRCPMHFPQAVYCAKFKGPATWIFVFVSGPSMIQYAHSYGLILSDSMSIRKAVVNTTWSLQDWTNEFVILELIASTMLQVDTLSICMLQIDTGPV